MYGIFDTQTNTFYYLPVDQLQAMQAYLISANIGSGGQS